MRLLFWFAILCPILIPLSACGGCNAKGNNNVKAASCSLFNGHF